MVNPRDHGKSARPTGATPSASWCRGFNNGPPALRLAGLVLLILFGVALGVSLTREPLPRAVFGQTDYEHHRVTNILVQPFIGLDFHHNYRAVKAWHGKGDPYAELTEDPANTRYVYPPLTLVAFTWAEPFPSAGTFTMRRSNGTEAVFGLSLPAILVWLVASLAIITFAAWRSWQARAELGLSLVPLAFILGATLLTYPVLFELERGNCNVLPLLATTILAGLLNSPSRHRHWVMGLCVSLAIGIKPYAIVLLPALLVLRQFRAAAWSLGWLAFQGLVLWAEIRAWLGVAADYNQTETPEFMDWSHSIISHWKLTWTQLGATGVASWPAQLIVAALLFVVCAVVSWPLLRARHALPVAWPFLLWLLAVGTMLLPIAYDYNLLFIPLLLACAWQARDPWWVHLLAALALVWLQPFHFGLTGLPLLGFKVASILSLGALVMRRSRELGPAPDQRQNPATDPATPPPLQPSR